MNNRKNIFSITEVITSDYKYKFKREVITNDTSNQSKQVKPKKK